MYLYQSKVASKLTAINVLTAGSKTGVVFSQRHFDQTQKFSSSELSILHCTENEKLGDENLGVFSEVYPNTIIF